MKRNNETVIEFEEAVNIKGKEVKSISLRRPKVKDMQRAAEYSSTPAGQEIWLISTLSDCPISDIENLDLDYYEQIQDELGKFRRSPMKSA